MSERNTSQYAFEYKIVTWASLRAFSSKAYKAGEGAAGAGL